MGTSDQDAEFVAKCLRVEPHLLMGFTAFYGVKIILQRKYIKFYSACSGAKGKEVGR
jgi:hypothetical protein